MADAEISRWAFTQTTREVGCPRCNAQPGDSCRTPRGRETSTPHVERCCAYHDKIGKAEFDRRHCFRIEQPSLVSLFGGAK
jgi:hypothetical protein